MKKINAKLLFLLSLNLVLGNFLLAHPVWAGLELVKAKGSGTIYYLDSRGVRHPFPNEITYRSWYGNDFSKIVLVDNAFLQNYPLGKNITIRPGTYLVKVQTSPQVYTVEQGGVLRLISDEYIAEAIYGDNWTKKVVDVPDVFFGNYIIGEPIVHDYTLPDSVLYQDQKTKKYYYKNNGILRPFSSQEAVLANRFRLSDALVSDRSFFIRTRSISGLDKNIFNPVAEPNFDLRDCENKKLKAAIIFLADKNYSNKEIENLQRIKDQMSERFSWVTYNLASLDVNYPTAIFLDDGYLIKKNTDGTTEVNNEVINSFYDNNADVFDFIFVWTNFKLPSETTNEIAHFIPVTNKQEGVGRPILDRSEIYGSLGKLKGVIMMGNINKYHAETATGLSESLNIAMHEILHQWSAYIEFANTDGTKNKSLLRPDDFQHWGYYDIFISPLGGSGWLSLGEGKFENGLTKLADTNLRQYSKLDLYLMGLIPHQLMEPIMYLEPKTPNETGNLIYGTPRQVTIDQIIKLNGQVGCSTD